MERYSKYMVDFNRKYKADKDVMDPPVCGINVQVFAKDISEAMQKAWDAVRVTPEDYEIDQITRDGVGWRR
jgi:hypothetical protein